MPDTRHSQGPAAVPATGRFRSYDQLEVVIRRFIHNENIARYRKLIAISEGDPARDEVRHQMLLKLLAEEEAKDSGSPPAAK